MFNRYRLGLVLTGVVGSLIITFVLTRRTGDVAPAEGCLARLTALDHLRFEQAGRALRFDGTLLFNEMSLHVEGMLRLGGDVFRVNRQVQWTGSWLSPGRRTIASNHIYFGDTLPEEIAVQLPLVGEPIVNLRFEPSEMGQFAVFANDVFFTYCRRL